MTLSTSVDALSRSSRMTHMPARTARVKAPSTNSNVPGLVVLDTYEPISAFASTPDWSPRGIDRYGGMPCSVRARRVAR